MQSQQSQTPRSRPHIDRRLFLTGAAGATIVVLSGAIFHPKEAWALETKNLKPETMRTLIKLARDIYPHDRLADKFYAVAVKSFDEKSSDPAMRNTIETSIAELDAMAKAAFGAPYADVGWECERTQLLQKISATPFFQSVRGGLVVSLYNQQEVWPLFGYEGESASKGGYINRGFNDITWL